MQDLNKARDEALAYVIRDIENRETDPLTAVEKERAKTLIEDAMLQPVKDYDDLSDYVNGELTEEALKETSSCFSQGKEQKRCEAR